MCPGPDRATRIPSYRPPAGATDCHAHIFGPPERFPYSAERSYTPETCSAEQYDAMLATIGFTRAAVVQGGAHGTDNRVTLDAIARRPDTFRGVAVIPSGLPPDELAALNAGGIRGARLSTLVGIDFSHLARLAGETHELGWHIVLHFKDAAELVGRRAGAGTHPQSVRSRSHGAHHGRRRRELGAVPRAAAAAGDRPLLREAREFVPTSAEPYPHRDMLPMIHAVVAARPGPHHLGQQLAAPDSLPRTDAQRR